MLIIDIIFINIGLNINKS